MVVRRWSSNVGHDLRAGSRLTAGAAGCCHPAPYPGSINGVKVSVSLPEADIAFLDSYAHQRGIGSRSAALHRAVGLLRAVELSDDYSSAWQEWADSADEELWGATLADGVSG